MKSAILFSIFTLSLYFSTTLASLPIVVNTWAFTAATDAAYNVLTTQKSTVLDAVEIGCATCETLQCDGTVGYGGSPDENGETTLDALIMDGTTLEMGAVVSLRNVKNAVGVARAVMDYTSHSILAGSQATNFAISMGFSNESLQTPQSQAMHVSWLENNCQPNYRRNVLPDATKSCGPYKPIPPSLFLTSSSHSRPDYNKYNHDTIAVIAIDENGSVAAATSTNGARNKIPGRVGDSPIIGAGAYADSDVGGCGATGDGDVMMRFLPCFLTVELMRGGATPQDAATQAMRRIMAKYPTFQGALVAVNKKGEHAGVGVNWTFQYSVRSPDSSSVQVITVPPLALS